MALREIDVPRLQNEVRGEPLTAHRYACGSVQRDGSHCTRTVVTEVNGTLVIKRRCGSELHAKAIPLSGLIKDYIQRAPVETLKSIEEAVVNRLTGLAKARARRAP